MATWYVDSTATGTAAGTSWANATTTLAAAITLSAAGDDFDVSSAHAESTAGAVTLAFKGTAASPNRVYSCDKTNSPAQASDLLAGAAITMTGANLLTITGFVYIYGVTFNVGTGTTSANMETGTAASDVVFDTCAIKNLVTVATCSFAVAGPSSAAASKTRLVNTTVSFNGGTGCNINVTDGILIWDNTPSAAVGGTQTAIANLFLASAKGSVVRCDGLDLTAIASGKNLVAAQVAPGIYQFINCRLTSGVTVATPTGSGVVIDLINCDSGATGYKQSRYTYQGTLSAETTIVNNATDGTTPISWKVVTTANSKRQTPFECFEIAQWVDTTGVSKTATISCVTDLAVDATALTNADIWVEAQVLDNASYPLSSLYTSAPATLLTAGSTLASGTWATTTGMTTPDARKMTVTFTNQIAGLVRFTVKVARASLTTLRVDPDVVIA